jgi:methylthioribose-1-phosphate isomerase
VAAPFSTIDLAIPDGDHIPIEERSPDEVTHLGRRAGRRRGAGVRNPAFDVTPNRYVTAIITDRGVARPPYIDSIRALAP